MRLINTKQSNGKVVKFRKKNDNLKNKYCCGEPPKPPLLMMEEKLLLNCSILFSGYSNRIRCSYFIRRAW